jgi:hypothetical protein
VCYNVDGSKLVSGSENKEIIIWSALEGYRSLQSFSIGHCVLPRMTAVFFVLATHLESKLLIRVMELSAFATRKRAVN